MTKEQIEKEAKAECFMLTVNTIGIDQRDVELAYILGRNKSIEQIEALEKSCDETQALTKENEELNDKLNNLARVAKVRLGNWRKYADAYNETQELLDKQIETTYKVVEENNELKEKLNKATEILKVVLNKWKEERWILQSEKEVKMIENVMKEAEAFLKED